MSFSIGQQVGPYRIEQKLGQGGMATVYKAYHEALDRHVAVKVMHIALSEDETFLERFKREAQIVGRLLHPNIIPIFDYAAFENQPYLVMQYVSGQTLKQRMRLKPLTLQEVTEVLNAVASALDYAHQNDVLHRDVKPSNVMLDGSGRPYLTDFGLARIASLGESTLSTDMMLGTPQYISPEQAKGVRSLDAGTDIYSLGVVLYELVVGRVPFTADTPYTIIHDHIYKPLPLPTEVNPGVPRAVERVLLKVLHKERSQRYGSAGELAAHFAKAVQQSEMKEISHHELRPEAFHDDEHPLTPSESVVSPSMTSDGIPIEIITPTPVDRVAVERQSQSRAQFTPQAQVGYTAATPTPSPAVPSPIAGPGGSVLVPGTAVDYQVAQTGNGWMIAGCLVFIVSCLVSVGIVLGVMNEPRFVEEWEEVSGKATQESLLRDDDLENRQRGSDLLVLAQTDSLDNAALDIYVAENTNAAGDINTIAATALLALQADDTAQALALLDTAPTELDADSVADLLAWADLYAENGFNSASLVLYALAVTTADAETPVYAEAVEDLQEHFQHLMADGQLTQAHVNTYQEALPTSTDAVYAESLLAYVENDEATGAALLAELAAEAPDNITAEKWLSWAEVAQNYEQLSASDELYRLGIEVFADNEQFMNTAEDYFYNQLVTAAQQNRLSQDQVTRFNDLFPNAIGGTFAQALIHFETDNADAGMEMLFAVTTENQRGRIDDVEVVLDWASIYAARGYNEQALVAHLVAYIIGGETQEVRDISGGYLYDRAVSSTPPEVMIICGARNQLPDFTFMELITAQALISVDIINNRNVILSRSCPGWTRLDSIEGILETAREEAPEFAELYLVYGNYYESEDMLEQAVRNWQQAIALDDAPAWVRTRAENKLSLYANATDVTNTTDIVETEPGTDTEMSASEPLSD